MDEINADMYYFMHLKRLNPMRLSLLSFVYKHIR